MEDKESIDRRKLGARIKEFRGTIGLTQREAADKAALSRSYWTQIEQGTKATSFSTLVRIADALSVPVHRLVNTSGEEDDLADPFTHFWATSSDKLTDEDKHVLIAIAQQILSKQG
jgi:transcriptional regulator with XRE-family HTH domain